MLAWWQREYEKIWSVLGRCTVSEKNGKGKLRGHRLTQPGLHARRLLN